MEISYLQQTKKLWNSIKNDDLQKGYDYFLDFLKTEAPRSTGELVDHGLTAVLTKIFDIN